MCKHEEREGDKKEKRCKKKEERRERKKGGCYLSLNEVCKHEKQGLHDTAGGHTLHLAQH